MDRVVRWIVAAWVVCSVSTALAGERADAPPLPADWEFSLPAGDAAAGKEAFRKLQCYSCHRTPGADDLPEARSSGGIGPDLVSAYGKLPREFLAESIIDSHKYISGSLERYTGLDKTSSKMGDYSDIMSVGELIDVVEFLKQPRITPPAAAGKSD